MNKVACIKHRMYAGKTAPDLGCKTCCHIYVETLKRQAGVSTETGFDTYKWVTAKTMAATTTPGLSPKHV